MAKGVTAELQLRNWILQQRAILADVAKLDPMSGAYARKIDQLFNALGLDVAGLGKGQLDQFVREVDRAFVSLSEKFNVAITDTVEDYAILAYQGQVFAFEQASVAVTAVSTERVLSAARNSFVLGNLLSTNLSSLSQRLILRTNGHIRDGWVQGSTNSEILREIRGAKIMRVPEGETRAKAVYRLGGSDIGVWRNQAEAIVRTGANSYATQARELFAAGNHDVIRRVRWTAVLDNRTTFICMSRDGQIWSIDSNYPVPPAHWNCRSVLIYLTLRDEVDDFFVRASRVPKSQRAFDELSEFRQTDPKVRSRKARTVGRQVEVRDFNDFLQQLPRTHSANAYLKDLFGSDVAVEAFRGGEFTLRDLVRRGKPLLKSELRSKFQRIKIPAFPRSEL